MDTGKRLRPQVFAILVGVIATAVCACAAADDSALPNACSIVYDTTAPSITLVGNASLQVAVGATYTDAGATATDNMDGDETARLVINNPVNTAVPGRYTVTFTVTDLSGNSASTVTRTVIVLQPDVTKPVIVLNGNPSVTIEVLSTYADAGATATDNVDGDITGKLAVISTVNTSKLGSYTVTYTVSDAAGNAADPVVRSVKVVDTTPPVITIKDSPT